MPAVNMRGNYLDRVPLIPELQGCIMHVLGNAPEQGIVVFGYYSYLETHRENPVWIPGPVICKIHSINDRCRKWLLELKANLRQSSGQESDDPDK